MELSQEQRLDLIKMEMELIQSTLDKYDDLIFRNRNWFITLWMGTIGLGFTIKVELIPLFACVLSILYWIIEGLMRHQYWYKYVLRYRTLRDKINETPLKIDELSLYDLTNQYMKSSVSNRIKKSFFKVEPMLLYCFMAICAVGIWLLMKSEIINLN